MITFMTRCIVSYYFSKFTYVHNINVSLDYNILYNQNRILLRFSEIKSTLFQRKIKSTSFQQEFYTVLHSNLTRFLDEKCLLL